MIDYEKKYKEALERAKSFQEKYGGDYAGYIFPQLRESEDERIRKRLIEYFEGFRMGNVEVRWEGLIVQEVLAWLEKQKEQKPAEWSEEDEKMLEGTLMWLDDLEKQGEYVEKERLWLKSLRPQPKQEWSEEDSEMMMRIINQVGGYTYFAGMDSERVVNWLKSLRPVSKESLQSWKPSEEQMKALYSALNYANDAISLYSNKFFPLYEEISRKRFDILESLYNDLKKLM